MSTALHKMRDDPAFNINFIQCIENFHCLWNHKLKEYSKRDITDQAWRDVAKEVKDSEANCRERWRNIRGAFARSRRQSPSGSGTKKPYYLKEYLQFLVPYMKGNQGSGNLPDIPEKVRDDTSSTFSESEVCELSEIYESPSQPANVAEGNVSDSNKTDEDTSKDRACSLKRV